MLSCGKNGRFARFFVAQGFLAGFSACVSGYAEAVIGGLRCGCRVPPDRRGRNGAWGDGGIQQEPEKGGIFGVLGDDVKDNGHINSDDTKFENPVFPSHSSFFHQRSKYDLLQQITKFHPLHEENML